VGARAVLRVRDLFQWEKLNSLEERVRAHTRVNTQGNGWATHVKLVKLV
jgi:hypothetical protein